MADRRRIRGPITQRDFLMLHVRWILDMEICSGGELGDNEMSCTPSSRGFWLLNASIEVDVTGVV